MSVKYHALFLISKDESGICKVRYRVKWDNCQVAFGLGYRVEQNKWVQEAQRCKPNTTHGKKKISAFVINSKIDLYEKNCKLIFESYKKPPSVDEFRNDFNAAIGRKKKKVETFFEIFDLFIEEESRANIWTDSTVSKLNTIKNTLLQFDPKLDLLSINEEKLIEFQYFLQENLNYRNSTIKKSFSFFKWFLRWVKKRGYEVDDSFEYFTPKLKTTSKNIIFLTKDEINQLINYKIPESKLYLEKVRDVFIFLCFTGLRYSDAKNLKKSNIRNDHIYLTTMKTSDSLIIELNDRSKAILEKYSEIELENNRALPVISNQKMNDYIKELAELANINDSIREVYYQGNNRIETETPKFALLSTHAGRRTFICNALALGIPPHVVMKWTGHSDYKSMKPYIGIADDIKSESMNKFNLL